MLDLRQILTDQKLPAEILKAAEIGDLTWFKLCLTNAESKNSTGQQGESYVHIAAAHLHRNIIDFVQTQKVTDINGNDDNGRNALHWALIWSATRKVSQKRLFAMVELLHSYGASLTQQDKFGACPFHYAAMTGRWKICEYFINIDQNLLKMVDTNRLYAKDWAVLWGKRDCAAKIKNAEWKLNFRYRDDQIMRLKKFKKYFCSLQMEAIECMRHDVTFYSDVAYKSFLAEKNIHDGNHNQTMHEEELKNGLRQRLRKSGKMKDKSEIIERISVQQQRRQPNGNNSRMQSAREPRKNKSKQPNTRPHKLTENWNRPLSSKAGLPVQLTSKGGAPFLKVDLTYYDGKPAVALPKLPLEQIRAACGDATLFRMNFKKNNFKTLHIDDNKKTRGFEDVTEIQHHLKTFHVK